MKTLPLFFALAAVCLLPGCGKPGARKHLTEGAVSIDGVPAAAGVIRFEPVEQGDLPGGAVIVDGRYTAWLSPGPKLVRLAVEGDRTGLKPTDLSPNIVPQEFLKNPPEIAVPAAGAVDFHLGRTRRQ